MDTPTPLAPALPQSDDFLAWGHAAVARWPLRPDQVALFAPTPGEFVLIWTMQHAPDPQPVRVVGFGRRLHPFEMDSAEAERHAEAERRVRADARLADNLAKMLDPLLPASLARGVVMATADGALAMVRSAGEAAPAWWSAYPDGAESRSYTAALLARVRRIAEGAPIDLYSVFDRQPGEVLDPVTEREVRASWSAAEIRRRDDGGAAS